MGIIRGIKIYDVGLAVASPSLGITVENWASGDVSLMTIDETDSRLAVDWDNGFSIKSDMRNYPKEPSGSGGVITFNDDGWYSTFLSSGYNLEGCRIERNWVENGDKMLSQYFVDKVKQGIGVVTLSLLSISCQMASDITGAGSPLIVGDWENAELEQVGEETTPLFSGMKFRPALSIAPIDLDEFDAPLSFTLALVPSDPNFPMDGLSFPESSFCEVASGTGEGSVFTVPVSTEFPIEDGSTGKFYYKIVVDCSRGLFLDDDNPLGIKTKVLEGESITDLSIFTFYTSAQQFLVDPDSTVDSVAGDGNPLSNYTNVDGIITLDTQTAGSSVKQVTVLNNDEYDMTSFTSVPSSRDGSVYYRTGQSRSSITNEQVDDKDWNSADFVSSSGLAGLSYEVSEDIATTEGICIEAEILTDEPAVDGVFNIVIMGAWGVTSSDWVTEPYEEELTNIEIPFGLESAGVEDKYCYISNIGSQYFTNSPKDLTNAPFDDRDETDGQLTASIRGRVNFQYTNGAILDAQPDKIYILVYSTLTTRDATPLVAPLQLTIRQLALFGESNNTSVVDTLTASITGRDWGTIGETITNVATEMDWSKFENVSIDVPVLPALVRGYISSANELKTDVALQRLHRESWTVGYLDKTGTYKVTDVSGKIGSGDPVASTHDFVLPNGYMLKDEILNYEADGLPTGGTIQYSRTSSGGFQKSITITSAEQDTYDSSYVTGVTDSAKAEELWNICRLIFLKTGVLYDVRKDMQELWWLYDENDAIQYFTNILEWNGGSTFARNVVQLDVDVADIDSSGDVLPWVIGDACNVTIPNITNGAYAGVVTGVKYDKEGESAIVSCRVGEIVERPSRIIERGNIIDNTITELDTNVDTYTEVGLS